jgi:cytoskeletal protein CcmA (bactofilin family)
MFSKKNKVKDSSLLNQKQPEPNKPAVPSILSRDLVMTGDLSSDGEIQVDGKVIGDIKTKSLLVGNTANIKGEIIADDVRVHGTVDGQIKAHTVTLAKTSHVVGDILHVNLSIETGAFLEGLCKRMLDAELKDASKISLIKKDPELDNPAPSSILTNNPKNVLS